MAIWTADYEPDDLQVKVSELLVATSDTADRLIDESIPEVLRLLRDRMKMDVVFVSEFTGGNMVFRHVVAPPVAPQLAPGASRPLEQSWCNYVVEGRLPELIADATKLPEGAAPSSSVPIGTFLSVPIVLRNGSVYGTLCCFSFAVNENVGERDLRNLRFTASLAAKKIEQSQTARPDLSLVEIPEEAKKKR